MHINHNENELNISFYGKFCFYPNTITDNLRKGLYSSISQRNSGKFGFARLSLQFKFSAFKISISSCDWFIFFALFTIYEFCHTKLKS